MFSAIVWIVVGVVYIVVRSASEGHFEPASAILCFIIMGLGAAIGGAFGAILLMLLFVFVVGLWLVVETSGHAEKYHREQMSTNPYYNPVTRQTELWTERERKLTPGIAKAILKIDYSDIPAKYGLSRGDIDAVLRLYVLDRELVPPKYEITYLRRLESNNPYDNIVTFLDLHCLKNGVRFRKWGCLDNEVVFPLDEHVRKYKSELDRLGIKVNTDHSGYQKRVRLPQRYQFRENAEKAANAKKK